MRILLESRAFHPSFGGLEMMSRQLAEAWQKRGHDVQVATVTALEGKEELPGFSVVREPSFSGMQQLVRWSDVFVQSGISLRSLPHAVLAGTPLVIIHHRLLSGEQESDVRAALKRWATHLGVNVAVSHRVVETVPGPVLRIPNAFLPDFDQPQADDRERQGLLFVGRLVSEKGGDVAIEALRHLRAQGIDTTLTICGEGPERHALEQQAKRAGVNDVVLFEGRTAPEKLVEHYQTTEVLLAPSYYESFGIVVLEALASGCPVVASNVGGLPEAVNGCGLLVPPGDPGALARATKRVLCPDVRGRLKARMPAHVDRHRIDRIATDYLHLLRRVAQTDS